MMNVSATLVTTDPAKLPLEYQRLIDSQQALPSNMQFFEEQKTWGSLLKRLWISLVLMVVGFALIVTGLRFFLLLVMGIACWFGAFLAFRSIWPSVLIMNRQKAGQATRYGVFIGGDTVLIHTDLDLTLIPRQNVTNLDGGQLHYTWSDKPKVLSLPGTLVGAQREALLQALRQWRQG